MNEQRIVNPQNI